MEAQDNFRMQGMGIAPPGKASHLGPLHDLTGFQFISPLEFYLTSKRLDSTCKWEEINTCSLCMCDLFDDIDDTSDHTLMQTINQE